MNVPTTGLTVGIDGKIEPSAIERPSMPAHPQLGIDHGEIVVRGSHAAGAGRVVDGVVHGAAVLAQRLVALDRRAGRDLALDPVGERPGRGHLAGDLEAVDDRLLVVAVARR